MARQYLTDILREVVQLLGAAKVPHAVVGGLAFSMLVRPRATVDLDLLVQLDESQLPQLNSALSVRFPDAVLHPRAMHLGRCTLYRAVLPWGSIGGVVVDFLLSTEALHRLAVERGALRIDLEGVTVAVVQPEDLILLKLLAGRPQDLLDVRDLRQVYESRLDEGYLAQRLLELGLHWPR